MKMYLHPILRLEKTSLAGDAFESDSTKAELLRKRLAEVKSIKIHPVLSKYRRKINKCLKGAKVWQEGR